MTSTRLATSTTTERTSATLNGEAGSGQRGQVFKDARRVRSPLAESSSRIASWPEDGRPVVFLTHLAAVLDKLDPRVEMASRPDAG